MRKLIGGLFVVCGTLGCVIVGLWGLFICLGIVYNAMGNWAILAFFLGPITIVVAPWYALFSQGDWFPLALNYGGGLIFGLLKGVGDALVGSDS